MSTPSDAPYRLSLLGPWDLTGPDGQRVRSVLSQPKRLCLLAYLALAAKPVARSTLVALFWPESDEDRARNALSQAVHYLRRSLRKDAVVSVEGDRLLVPSEVVWFDVRVRLEEGGQAEGPTELGRAGAKPEELPSSVDFFAGWNADDSQPLQEWLDGVRRRVRERAEARPPPRPTEGHEDVPVASGGGVVVGRGGGIARPLRATAVAAVVVLTVGVAWTAAGRMDGARSRDRAPGTAGGAEIAVLLPHVVAADGTLALSAEALHAELLTRLDEAGVRVSAIPYAETPGELQRFLTVVGDGSSPDLVLTLIVRIAGGDVRVTALLLGGPSYTDVVASSARSYDFERDTDVVVGLPERIAGAVVEAVRRP